MNSKIIRHVASVAIIGSLIVSTPVQCYANERKFLDAPANAFQGLRLTLSVAPQSARSTQSIVLSFSLSNPTNAAIGFPGSGIYFFDTVVDVKSMGVAIAPDHSVKRPILSGFRYWFLDPGKTWDNSASLFDLGYDLKPGHYVLRALRFGPDSDVVPIYSAPQTIDILE